MHLNYDYSRNVDLALNQHKTNLGNADSILGRRSLHSNASRKLEKIPEKRSRMLIVLTPPKNGNRWGLDIPREKSQSDPYRKENHGKHPKF